jgi:hypothetical protein
VEELERSQCPRCNNYSSTTLYCGSHWCPMCEQHYSTIKPEMMSDNIK